MAFIPKLETLNAICRARGGAGGHARSVHAFNEWARLLGGAGRHARNVEALDEICARLGAPAGHRREIDAANALSVRLGGSGGHRRVAAALEAIAPLTGAEAAWAPGRVRLFGAGDSRLADGRQGTAPYDSGYVLHRYSALNLAVWGAQGRVDHDARTDLFATAGSTLQQWIDTHLAALLAAMAGVANPVVLVHLGTHSLPSVPLAEMQAQAAQVATAVAGAGGRLLWLLEGPRSGPSALSPENEAKRLAFNAWLRGQEGGFGGRFAAVDYLAAFTADGSATGAARAGLQRDGLHDTQAGADVKAAAVLARLAAMPPVTVAVAEPLAAPYAPGANPGGNRLAASAWEGEVRNPGDTEAGVSLTCSFATEAAEGRSWQVMRLGGSGGGGEQARLLQAPYADGYGAGDTVRYRVRVRWEGLSGVRAVKVVVFHYGAAFFGINTGSAGAGPAPAGRHEEVLEGRMVLSANPSFFQVKLMVEADGTGPVAGIVRWADAELRRI